MNIKKKIWKVLGVSALVSLVAYAAIDFTIDQDPAAQGASSVMSSLLPGATSYLDISGNEDGNGDIMAETIALTQLTKDSQISSIDLNAKFASLMILHAKLRCQMLETGVWDDVEKDCDIDTGVEGSGDPRNDGWGASSCTQYETYKTCDEDLSGLGDCIWTDSSGDWRCEDPAAPVVVAQISTVTAFDTGDVAIPGNIEFSSEGQALSEVLGRIRVELDAPADFCALHAGNVSIADEVAYSGVSSCGNDGVDYCDIDNFTGNFDSTETYLVACNTGGTYSNSIDVSDNLVLQQSGNPSTITTSEALAYDVGFAGGGLRPMGDALNNQQPSLRVATNTITRTVDSILQDAIVISPLTNGSFVITEINGIWYQDDYSRCQVQYTYEYNSTFTVSFGILLKNTGDNLNRSECLDYAKWLYNRNDVVEGTTFNFGTINYTPMIIP